MPGFDYLLLSRKKNNLIEKHQRKVKIVFPMHSSFVERKQEISRECIF